MRHFISVIPLQQKLSPMNYANIESVPILENNAPTCFPILIPMANLAQKDETIRVTSVITETESAKRNYETFLARLNALKDEKGFEVEMCEIKVPFEETSAKHLKLFEDIISNIKPDERLTADITFGNKPTPMAILMALNYAYQYCENTAVEALVCGEVDFSYRPAEGEAGKGFIFDTSALFYMNSLMNRMAVAKPSDPLGFIRSVIG